jgi:hypothetical protein
MTSQKTLHALKVLDITASIVFASFSIVYFFRIGLDAVLIALIAICLFYTASAIVRSNKLKKMKPLTRKILYHTSLMLLIITAVILICAIIVKVIG